MLPLLRLQELDARELEASEARTKGAQTNAEFEGNFDMNVPFAPFFEGYDGSYCVWSPLLGSPPPDRLIVSERLLPDQSTIQQT